MMINETLLSRYEYTQDFIKSLLIPFNNRSPEIATFMYNNIVDYH